MPVLCFNPIHLDAGGKKFIQNHLTTNKITLAEGLNGSFKDTFSTFNVSNPFHTLTSMKEPLAASGQAACLNSARMRAQHRNYGETSPT